MGYAATELTSLNKLLAEVKISLGIYNSTTEDIAIKMHLIEGAKEMMTLNELVELTATLPIEDFKAPLPCEFVRFDRPHPIVFTIDGVVPEGNGTYYMNNWNLTYTGGPFLTASPIRPISNWFGIPTVQVQDGYLYFSNNVDATECTISYQGLNLFDNGDMKIPAVNGRPIKAYAIWMYGSLMGTMTESTISRFERIWTNGKLDRRAKAAIPDSLQKERISRIMHSLL